MVKIAIAIANIINILILNSFLLRGTKSGGRRELGSQTNNLSRATARCTDFTKITTWRVSKAGGYRY